MAINKKGYIVAEIGNNHDGNFNKAVKLIEEAKEAGVDCVKFQCINYENWVDKRLKVFSRAQSTGYKTQLERLKAIELSPDRYEELAKICGKLDIDFSCTIFDMEIMERLKRYLSFAKVSSGEIHNMDTLDVAKKSGREIVISSGLSRSIQDIENALNYINIESTYVMHCVSRYPSSLKSYEWNNFMLLQSKYGKDRIGLSDHTKNIYASIMSLGGGCRLIERHFKLKEEKGTEGDKPLSSTAEDIRELVNIKNTLIEAEEKYLDNTYTDNSEDNKSWDQLVRKAHSKKFIKEGDVISKEDIYYKISGEGERTSFDIFENRLIAMKDMKTDEALTSRNSGREGRDECKRQVL